ncbi:MAG: GlsB/YeaQ/YmgE family stress response rane protein [Chloroflexi bacterium]|nr:GlsB/YeaQ/YmgE family stress response rane protein [Chloroflexota bacterium]
MVSTLAEVWLNPGHFLAWLAVGLIAGWIASNIMSAGYGLVGDLILGLVGAFIGGWLVGLFVTTSVGFVGSIVVAVIGAVVLIALARLLTSGRTTRGRTRAHGGVRL